MAGITHTPVVGTAEGSDPTKIRKSNWEADHNIADGTITLAMLAFDVATQVELNALSASLGSAAFTSAGSYEVPLTFSTGLSRIGNTITAAGGSGTVTSVGLVGTANQLTVTGSSPITGSGSWTLSIPGSAQLSIAKLTNLTSNGLVTTSGGDGTLSVTSLGTGVATFLSTPSSANLAAALTDEVGTNKIAFTDSPTFVTPTLGVASATSLTTTVLKSATTVAIQTNGTTQAVLFGTDQSATFAGTMTGATHIGGTGTTSTLTLQPTSGVGTAGADILFKVGNNGATTAAAILNNGFTGVGIATPLSKLHVKTTTIANQSAIMMEASSTSTTLGVDYPNFMLVNPSLTNNSWATIAFDVTTNAAGQFIGAIIGAQFTNAVASNSQKADLVFATKNGTAGFFERMRIDSAGVVNLTSQANTTVLKSTGYSVTSTGTTSMLDLAGTLNGTGIVHVIMSNITKTAANAASTHLNLKTDGTSVFSVDLLGVCNSIKYKVNGTAGANFGPGLPTSITVVDGIVTAAS